MHHKIIQGDNREALKQFPDNHFDSIVTDPPYGIDFLGKSWDANTGALETYQECLRVLKPGGHILAFSAARTYHHLAVTLEQAGFEIRDQIMWIYSSGFPKSQDVGKSIERSLNKKDPNYGSKKTTQDPGITDSFGVGSRCNKCNRTFNPDIIKNCKEEPCGMQYQYQTDQGKTWAGWGTQLKPAHEPIALARKPLDKNNSIARNCQQWSVGALNIDATRIAYADDEDPADFDPINNLRDTQGQALYAGGWSGKKKKDNRPGSNNIGNGGNTFGNYNPEKINKDTDGNNGQGWTPSNIGRFPSNVLGEIAEPYQKYFYCPKVSRAERHVGHDMPKAMFGSVQGAYGPDGNRMAVGLDARVDSNKGNNHPTVKPIELMKYLIQLVTPAGGRVLDPFNGSGSTGCAAVELGYNYTGIELDPAYVTIAERRIQAWYQHTHPNTFTELFKTC